MSEPEPCAVVLANDLETERRRNHHEILRDMLKVLVDAATARRLAGAPPLSRTVDETIAAMVELATKFADLAYPPPKAEGT